jgi:hypothetical protein
MKIEIDTEELEALIEFQRSMHSDAQDSCEYEEAAARKARWEVLRKLRKR